MGKRHLWVEVGSQKGIRNISKQGKACWRHTASSWDSCYLFFKHVSSQRCSSGQGQTQWIHSVSAPSLSPSPPFALHHSPNGCHVTDLKRWAFAFLFPSVTRSHAGSRGKCFALYLEESWVSWSIYVCTLISKHLRLVLKAHLKVLVLYGFYCATTAFSQSQSVRGNPLPPPLCLPQVWMVHDIERFGCPRRV